MAEKVNNIAFYHGTSTNYNIGEYLLPTSKLPKEKIKPSYRHHTAKVSVTSSIEAAKYYAEKDVESMGGEPIIYEVKPDSFSLIKINKTDYITSNAKIIGVHSE